MKNIPETVIRAARAEGFNSVEYVGEHQGAKVFGASSVDKDGLPEPTGLPTLILLKDGKTEIMCGEDSLKLLARLD